MKNNESKLKSILAKMGYSEIGWPDYNDVECLFVYDFEKGGTNLLFTVLEDEKIKVIGGNWSCTYFTNKQMLEFEEKLNQQRNEIPLEDEIPPESKGIMATLKEIRNSIHGRGSKVTEKNKDYER